MSFDFLGKNKWQVTESSSAFFANVQKLPLCTSRAHLFLYGCAQSLVRCFDFTAKDICAGIWFFEVSRVLPFRGPLSSIVTNFSLLNFKLKKCYWSEYLRGGLGITVACSCGAL